MRHSTVLVSFVLTGPQPSLLAPEKPVPGVQIVGTVQRKASRKKALGRGKKREGRNLLLTLFVFPLRAKKMVSDSIGLVENIGLVNSVLNLPDGQLMFVEEFE